MSSELLGALFRRRADVDSGAQTWESSPLPSSADAGHLAGLSFDAPSAQEWLQQLEPTPEEDVLAESLADELAERRRARPAHLPAALTQEDAARVEQLDAALSELRRQFAAGREGLGDAREELDRREKELQAREEALEAEREQQRLRGEARSHYPQPSWLENIEGTMNIGVVGNAGAGKSLLINKLRRVRPRAHGWAPVGVKETTSKPTMYPYPDQPKVCLWDLPGAGTAAVPSETYVQDMGLRYFDKVLICTTGRFTSTDVTLRTELERHKVPFFMVRTKVDIDVWNNKEDNGMDEGATIALVREDLALTQGNARAYLVSSRDPLLYDFPQLIADLFPGFRRQLNPQAESWEPSRAAAAGSVPAVAAWTDPWAMPSVLSPLLQGLQGRWSDAFNTVYLVHGNQVHVSLSTGHMAVMCLGEAAGCIWWADRWRARPQAVAKARCQGELIWEPVNPRDAPLQWWWSD